MSGRQEWLHFWITLLNSTGMISGLYCLLQQLGEQGLISFWAIQRLSLKYWTYKKWQISFIRINNLVHGLVDLDLLKKGTVVGFLSTVAVSAALLHNKLTCARNLDFFISLQFTLPYFVALPRSADLEVLNKFLILKIFLGTRRSSSWSIKNIPSKVAL
jgi:hypothetical protein